MFAICRGMKNEDYQKYKRDYQSYLTNGGKKYSSWRYMEEFEKKYPEIAAKYFDIVPDEIAEYGYGNK